MVNNTEKPQYMYITVRIKVSKTDSFCKGTAVYLGTTGTALGRVAAIWRKGEIIPVQRPNFNISSLNMRSVGHRTQGGSKMQLDMIHTSMQGHSYRIGAVITASLCAILRR